MTLDELKAAGQLANAIESAQAHYNEACKRLRLLQENRPSILKPGHGVWDYSWNPEITISKSKNQYDYGRNDVRIRVKIPYAVVEQSLVTEVEQARRKIVQLGGKVPTPARR